MKVLLLSRWYYPMIGGVENSIYQISRELVALGHEARIVTGAHPPKESREEYAPVDYLSVRSNRFAFTMALADWRVERMFRRALRSLRDGFAPELILSRDPILTNVALEVFPQTPVVNVPAKDNRAYQITTAARKRTGLRAKLSALPVSFAVERGVRAQARALTHSAINVVFCESLRRQLIASYDLAPGRVAVCYPGCSLPLDEAAANRAPGPVKNLLFVGRLLPAKNAHMLMDALALLESRSWTLTVVGDGSERAELEARARAEGLPVRFVGAQRDTRAYYLNADVLLLPSRYESFGQVIVEAFTCGVPVVGFASVPGKTSTAVEELVSEARTGFICREFSAAAFAREIRRALELSPAELQAMRCACFADASERFGWRRFVERTLALGLNATSGEHSTKTSI